MMRMRTWLLSVGRRNDLDFPVGDRVLGVVVTIRRSLIPGLIRVIMCG